MRTSNSQSDRHAEGVPVANRYFLSVNTLTCAQTRAVAHFCVCHATGYMDTREHACCVRWSRCWLPFLITFFLSLSLTAPPDSS